MSREARPRIFHRCVTALVSGTVALTLAAAPSLAQAGQPTLLASNMPTTGMKLRSIMSLQDPAADPAAAPADPAAPVASGPAPAPVGPAPAPAGPEPSRGLGMMITGAVITGAVALPFTFWGVYAYAQYNKLQNATNDPLLDAGAGLGKGASIALIATGLIFLSVGAPLLGVGAYKFTRWQKWKRGEQALAPSMNRTMHGTWTAGVALRF